MRGSEAPAEPAVVRRDDGSRLISGWMPALEFAEPPGIQLPSPRLYQTRAGFLLQEFGTIPGVDAGGRPKSSIWMGGVSTRCSQADWIRSSTADLKFANRIALSTSVSGAGSRLVGLRCSQRGSGCCELTRGPR